MINRKEKSIQHLYKVTNKLARPRKTSILEGNCQMRGPVDEGDLEVVTDFLSKNVNKCGSGCSSGHSDGKCRDTMALNNDDAVNSFDSPDSRDFKMSSTGEAAEKGFVDSGIGEKSSSRGLTENGENLLDVVKRKHDHVKRTRATKSMGEIANNGTDISQKTSKSQGDDMTNETGKSLKTKLASEPSSEIASKMHDLHTGVKNGGHLSSRETKTASEVVAPDDLDKDILGSNEESRSKTLDSDNSMTERDHFNSRRYITNKVSGRRIDLSIDVKAESSVKADPDTEYVANTDSTRQRSIKATEMPGAKDTLSLDAQAKLNVNVHCLLPKTFEVLEKHTGDTSCRSACKKGMQVTDGDSKDKEGYHSKSAEFFIKDEKHITNMTTEQGVASIDLKNMQSSCSKNMMDTMKSVKNIPEQRKISIPEDDKASKDSLRLTNMTSDNTNPSTRECVDVITPEHTQLIASSSTLDVNSSNSSVAKPASSGIFQHQISEAVSPSSTVMVGKIVDTLDPRFNQKRNTDNLHAVPSNPTASVNATTQLAMPSGDKSPKVVQNEGLTPHSKILSPRRLDSGVTENQCLINKTLITQESFKQSSDNGNPQDGAGSGTENEKMINQTERSLAVPEPAVEENSNDFGVIEDDVKVCDICGDAGQEEKLAVCSLCNDGAEHIYCMRIMLDKVPDGDWFCEECKLNKSISPNKSIAQSIKASKQEPSIVKKQNIDSNLSYRGAPSKVDRKSLLKRLVKGISQPQLSLKSTMKRSIEDSEPLPAAKKQGIDIRATQNATSTIPRAVLSRDNSFKADASKAKPLTPSALTGNKFSNAYSSNKLAAVPSTSSKPHGTSLATKNKHGSTNIFNTSEAARLGRTNSNVKTSGISVATADRVTMLSRSSDATALHSPTSRFSNSPKTASIVRGMKDSVEAGQPSEKRETAGNGQVMAGVNKIFGKSHSFKSLGTSNSYSFKESRSMSDSHNTGILPKGNPVARTKKDFDPQFRKSEKISNELAVSCGATPACTETSNSDSNSSQSNSKATSTRKEFGRSISITGRKSTDAFFGNTKSVGTASLAVASPETSETDSKSLKPSLPTASATSSVNVSEKLCNDSRKSSVVEASNKDVSFLVDNRISTTPSPKVGETGSTSSDNPRNDECIKKTRSTCSLPLQTSNALSDDLHMSSVVSKATKGLIGSHQSIPLTAENSNEAKTSIEIHPATCNKEELAIKLRSSAQSETQCEGEKLMSSSLLVGVGETKISESENSVEEIPANCSVSCVSGGAITSMGLGKNEELSSGTKISSQKMLLDEDLVSSQDFCRIKTSNSAFTIYPTESTVTAVRRDIPCGIAVVKDGASAGNSLGIVPVESTKRFASPDHNFLWQGAFEIKSKGDLSIFVGLQAHASTCAAPKVLDATKKFPSHISLEEAPRLSSWPKQFQCTRPNDENIALYFFAKDLDSYERSYRKLLDHMLKNDYALRGNVDGVDLLIFPSNQLPEQSQRWNRLLYLWGVFRERKAGCVENFNALEKIPGQFFSSGLNTANLNAKHPGSFSLSLSTPGSSQPSKADYDSRGIHAALRDKSLHKGEKTYLDRSFSLPSSSFQGEQEAMNSMAKLSDQQLQAGLATISEQILCLPIEYSLSQNDGKRPTDETSDRHTVSQTETAETEQPVERNAEIGSDKEWMTLSSKIENHSSDNLQDPKDSGHELHHYHSHSPPHDPSSLSLFSVKDQSLSQACARDIFQPQPLQSTSASELHGIHSKEITSQRKRLFNGFIADDKELKRLRKSYSEINVRDGFNQDWNCRNTSDKSSSELDIYSNNQQPTSSAHPFESSSSKHDEIGAYDQLRKTEQFFYPGLSVAENEDQVLFQQPVISYSQSKPVDHKFAQNIDDDPPVSMDIDLPNLELALGAKANRDKQVQPNAASVDRNTLLKPISKSISEDGSSLSLSLSISTSEKDSVKPSQAEKKALTEGVTPVLLFGGRLKG